MYFIILILILACFFFSVLFSRYKTRLLVLRLSILFFFTTSVLLFVWYLIKDLTRLGDFLEYFSFSRKMVTGIYSIDVPKDAIIIFMNFSCFSFLYCNLLYVSALPDFLPERSKKKLLTGAAILFAIQFIAFSPMFYSFLYTLFQDGSGLLPAVEGFYQVLEFLTNLETAIVLLLALFASVHTIRAEAESRFFLRNVLLVEVSFDILLVSYFFLLNNLPQLLVQYSSYTQSVIHTSLSSGNVMVYYKYFQYLLPAIVLVFVVSCILYSRLLYKLNNHSLKISRSIESANISSRIFCHFMKNEIIALTAEVEHLPTTPEGEAEVAEILRHCENLYERMDAVHKSMRDNVMDMQTYELIPLLKEVAASVTRSNKSLMKEQHIAMVTRFPSHPVYVFVDAAYFEQALLNLITNSLDAVIEAGHREKNITISVSQNLRWTNIEIRDNGCGISDEDLPNIFVPMFTTKPASKSWGLGLSLAYRTITSFHGRIRVKSTSPRGTTFEISLPIVKSKSKE